MLGIMASASTAVLRTRSYRPLFSHDGCAHPSIAISQANCSTWRTRSQAGSSSSLRDVSLAATDYKRAAASCLVKKFIRSNSVVGFGSGEMVNLAIEQIGQQLATGSLVNVTAVPACDAAAHEAAFHGVPQATLDQVKVDVAFDEVDQIDLAANAAIKGARIQNTQPQLQRTRAVAERATRFIVLADGADVVPRLGGALPVVIEAENWEEHVEELDDIFLGDAELWRRPAEGTDNPRGGNNPYVSPEGHIIIDVRFYESFKLFGEDKPYSEIAKEVASMPGLVTHGLFVGTASAAIIARRNGEPEVVEFEQR